MAKMIDFDKVYEYAFDGVNRGILADEDFNAIVNAIDSVDIVDLVDPVEIVRCCDCALEGTSDCPTVRRDPILGNLYGVMPGDGFCSKGRK